MQIEGAPRKPTKPQSGSPRSSSMRSTAPTRWLIAREDNGRLDPLCIESSEARVLPVFSYEEEAEMFLRLGGYACDDGWRARETSADELVCVLSGPCADARGVALDLLPGMLEDGTVGLVWVGRRRFLSRLSAGGGERAAS